MDIAVVVNHDHCNLTDPKLISMARQLPYSYIRVGGTEADFTYYDWAHDVPAFPYPTPPPEFRKVLTKRMWDNVVDFVSSIGLKMFFGLNAGWGPGVRNNETHAWNASMAHMLLNYSAGKGWPIAGFEFSNEPNLYFMYPWKMNESRAALLTGSQMAKDIVTVRQLIDGFSSEGWKLVCCDVAYVPVFGEFSSWVQDFAAGGGNQYVDYATFHFYPLLASAYNKTFPPALDPFYAAPKKVLEPLVLDQVGYFADQFQKDLQTGGNLVPPIWLGETGSAVGGGQNGLSNRFADVIEYVDKIGQMTRRGQQHLFRQTLCGSPDQYYALITHDITPTPTYFATAILLTYILPSGRALEVKRTQKPKNMGLDEKLRVYAMCGNGSSIIVVAINLDDSASRNMTVNAVPGSFDVTQSENTKQWMLTSTSLVGDTLIVNGNTMNVTDAGVIEPALSTLAVPAPQILVSDSEIHLSDLPPVSVSFWEIPVVPGIVTACQP